MYDAYPVSTMTYIEPVGSELLPCSSQFFHAGAEIPFGSPPREEQQAHQTVAAEVRELQGTAPAPVPQSAAWLQHTQPQAVSDLRTQQEHEVLAQLRAQQVQLLQLTAAVSQATASASFSISSSPSRKLLSLPNESQQLGIGSIDASRLFASRPGELSPVPEQLSSSPDAAVSGAAGHGNGGRRGLLHSQSQQYVQPSPLTRQRSIRSAPSSPKHDSMNFVDSSLSLQKTSEPTVGPPRQVLHSQEYQQPSSSHIAFPTTAADPDVAQIPQALFIPAAVSPPVQQQGQQQQQGPLSRDVGSSHLYDGRDLNRQLSSRPSSFRGSVNHHAELLLQAEVARLHDSQQELQERLLSSQQQLTHCQGLLAERQQQLLSAQELLAEQQEQLVTAHAELTAADQAKATLMQQLQHLEAKVQTTESQLEFAHKQLDLRLQEMRGQADATSAAQRSREQLAAEAETLKEELFSSRRELEAVNKRLALEAAQARRAADEAVDHRRDMAALQAGLDRSRQETADVKEWSRQEAAEANRRTAQMEAQISDMAQQIGLLKERGSAMQTTNDRLHHQLASAESDNVALRADLANLLRTQQELVDSREKSRQLQLEADRRMARLETDVSDLSQQLMSARSQSDRLTQRSSASEAEKAALHADLDNAREAAGAANRALQEAHMQQDQLVQQFKQQQRQQQLQTQQLRQQLERAAATAAVPPAVTGFGISSSSYQGLDLDSFRSSQRLDYGQGVAGAGLSGLESPPSRYIRYEDHYEPMPVDSYSYGRPAASAGAAANSSSPATYAARPGAAPLLGSPAREASAYYAGPAGPPAIATYSPGNRYMPDMPAAAIGDGTSRWPAAGTAAVGAKPGSGPMPAVGSVVAQVPHEQQAMTGVASKGNEAPWFAGGSRISPNQPPRPAAAQQIQQQQSDSKQQLQHTPTGLSASGYLVAEQSQRWQPYQEPSLNWAQQQQQPHGVATSVAAVAPAASAVVNISSPARLAPVIMSEQQQHLQAAAGGAVPTPFGTEMTVAEIMARTKELEDMLLAYCQEKDDLNKEFSKMPLGAGKTLKDRQRKQFLEQRLDELDSGISKTRMQLKKILGR